MPDEARGTPERRGAEPGAADRCRLEPETSYTTWDEARNARHTVGRSPEHPAHCGMELGTPYATRDEAQGAIQANEEGQRWR